MSYNLLIEHKLIKYYEEIEFYSHYTIVFNNTLLIHLKHVLGTVYIKNYMLKELNSIEDCKKYIQKILNKTTTFKVTVQSKEFSEDITFYQLMNEIKNINTHSNKKNRFNIHITVVNANAIAVKCQQSH